MPTPDLPMELWLEILSYLPQTGAKFQKMIGVNRALFELAMDDIYKQVNFTSDDERMVQRFRQLEDENLARRVHFLFIVPTQKLLPISNKGLNRSTSSFRRNILLAIGHVRSYAAAFTKSLVDPSFEVLNTAKKAAKHCRNADTIVIVVGDQEITPAFVSFSNSLWRPDSVGPNIKKIILVTTFAKLFLFLNPLVDLASTLTNLCEFHLQLELPGFENNFCAQRRGAMKALVSFFVAFKDALTSVKLRFLHFHDGRLFEKLPHLPNLRELSFLAPTNGNTFPITEGVTIFFSKHASNLEILNITFCPSGLGGPSGRYILRIINNEETTNLERLDLIAQVVFPRLHTFRFGSQNFPWVRKRIVELSPKPKPSRIMPNLMKLVMDKNWLSLEDLSATADSFAHEEGCMLEELVFGCMELSRPYFDLLAEKLPRLKALTINYDLTTSLQEGNCPPVSAPPQGSVSGFHNDMQISMIWKSLPPV
ncbi:hypothetical protein GALMADRAFT_281103 [Galerina marginata CBS 339.88]|uniref:F-box domain-containing protein n=1 Tax=Galerina marginata (strain CBS 339.88) TaxID=685588 RepID=A0A067SYS2_GALM3|nr:hypothetical protein GALMADRAFT_281103 [Galerina marginata CBS 339.88]